MAKSSSTKVKAPDLPVPQSAEQASDAISEVGRLRRECQRLETEMNDELAQVKERYGAEAKPHKDRVDLLVGGLRIFCEVRRDELTQGGKTKTATFPAGEVRWRTTPPKVNVRAKEAVLESLKRLGLERFVRTSEEPNKEAMLLEPDVAEKIPGVTITQKEEFEVVPFEAQLEGTT